MQKRVDIKRPVRTQLVNGILIVLGGALAAIVLAVTDGARIEAGYRTGMNAVCACIAPA